MGGFPCNFGTQLTVEGMGGTTLTPCCPPKGTTPARQRWPGEVRAVSDVDGVEVEEFRRRMFRWGTEVDGADSTVCGRDRAARERIRNR